MAKRDIIVIGASAGGIETLTELLGRLPADFPASIFVVQHMSATAESALADILAKSSALRVVQARDGERYEPGVVYVARPDHHLLLMNHHLSVARGPKENLYRPSVDALFRSAAYAHGSRVIGVVLSGWLDDGSAGTLIIKSYGGVCIAQDPAEALYSEMPRNAIRYGIIDYVETLESMPARIMELLQAEPDGRKDPDVIDPREVRVSESAMDGKPDSSELGTPSHFTCPACSGTLWEFSEGNLTRYRCRTGHAYSMNSMIVDQAEALERALWTAIRTLDEKADLMRRVAARAHEENPQVAERFEKRVQEAEDHALVLRDMLASMRSVETT